MTAAAPVVARTVCARAREVNERHGDDHGVNLTQLRAVAKRLKTQQELALELWATADTAANIARAVELVREAASRGAQIVCHCRDGALADVVEILDRRY